MKSKERDTTTVEVLVYDYKTKLLKNAEVTLKSSDKRRARPVRLLFDERTFVYKKPSVKPGRYIVNVKADGYETERREIKVGASRSNNNFVLGKKGMPFYYAGKVKVPFEPKSNLLGLSIRSGFSVKEEEQLRKYIREFKLEPEEVGKPVLQDNIRVFRFMNKINEKEKQRIQSRIQEHPLVRRVGPIVKIDKNRVTFLTNELVIKFKYEISKDEVYKIAKSYDLNIIREIKYAGNAYLLRSNKPASYQILKISHEIVKSGKVEYAEPNLVITVEDFQINPTDYLYPEQWHIPLVNLPDAWQLLRNSNSPGVMPGNPGDLTHGSEDIIIAVLDRGIQSQTVLATTSASHPDFDGSVTSGQSKVYRFYDFDNMVANNDNPPNNHGMGCAGVATALANNSSVVAGINEGVVGAAPNCRVMGLIRPAGATQQDYSDAFVWIAGFDPGPGSGLPAPPLPGADIISCSFSWEPWPINQLMMDTIDFVTSFGRSGKGTLIFYAAGNGNQNFFNQAGIAAHPKVMAVAASTLDDDGITEIRAAYSNFGDGIDFCAPSHDEYLGHSGFHNPPNNYGVISCDLLGEGNMPGHPATQTALTQAVVSAPITNLTANTVQGDTTLNVVNNNGFAINQWIMIGQHNRFELVQITAIPAGNTTLTITPLQRANDPGWPWGCGCNYATGAVIIGERTINVVNNTGFVANQWLLMEQPGQPGIESALIRNIPPGSTQVRILGPLNNHAINTPIITAPNNYRNSFGGTSSATPLVAGIAALVLSINPDLSWVQVRQILRDTADRIDVANTNPIGQWTDLNGDGFSEYSQWYGYGRINALAAVQEALNLVGVNPLNNIDTWIMENSSDIGDVPTSSPYLSPDVWVRNVAPAIDDPAQVNQHQSPIRGQTNWVYITVRNRGVIDSNDVYLRVYITRWAGTQYIYPDDFIPTNNPGQDPTDPLQPGTYLIGEEHLESIPASSFVTINMRWPAELIPPATVNVGGTLLSWADACLLVDVSPHDGPTPTGNNTWDNNNICQRNVWPVDFEDSDAFAGGFVLGHRTNDADFFNLRIEREDLPYDVKLYFNYLDEEITQDVIRLLKGTKEKPYKLGTCDLTLIEETEAKIYCSKTGQSSHVMLDPKTKFTFPCCKIIKSQKYHLHPTLIDNRTVFGIPTINRAYIPIPRKKGSYQVVALHAKGLRHLKKKEYKIAIYQEDLDGKIEGSLNFIIQRKRST